LIPVCILAGGLGTRLGARTDSTPKALIEVAGEPFLLHQLRLLAFEGASKVVLCVGHLGEQVEEAIGYRRFDVDISYMYDGPGLEGTLGAVRKAAPLLGERFLLLYGDTYLRIDYRRFQDEWLASGLAAGMTVLHNHGKWDRSNVRFSDGIVVRYEKMAPTPDMQWIDYGLGAVRTEALGAVSENERDLASLYSHLAQESQLFGFEATNRFYEIGTPDALAETERFLSSINKQ
jgi:NDP-sugar pyrophosphorylase family protein